MPLWIRYDNTRNIWEVSPNELENYFADLLEHHPREVQFGRWIEFLSFADAKAQGTLRHVEETQRTKRTPAYDDFGALVKDYHRIRKGSTQVWGGSQVDTLPAVSSATGTRIHHDRISNRLNFSTAGSVYQPVFHFERGGIAVNPNGITAAINIIAWYAPYACTLLSFKGYRVGGSGATVNARKGGSSNHLSSALSLTSADTWMDGGTVQNTAYAIGDKMEIMIVTVTGSPTQIGVQLNFVRP